MKYSHPKGFFKDSKRGPTNAFETYFIESTLTPKMIMIDAHSADTDRYSSQEKESHIAKSWVCDYCNVAAFSTYQEACDHEMRCTSNTKPNNRLNQSMMKENTITKQRKIILATSKDTESLSDRQCYVRREFVEIFTATEEDVNARHSKGAQKLNVGQVGIRCIYCISSNPKDRAERAVCYPSSISRIYQTVADMQRFHFECCSYIPDEMKNIYTSLKTTRPRGQGSPQKYWYVYTEFTMFVYQFSLKSNLPKLYSKQRISSAKLIGLVDTPEGIYLNSASLMLETSYSKPLNSPSSPIITQQYSSLTVSSTITPPTSESGSAKASDEDLSDSSSSVREADMLLALRRGISK